MQVVQDRWWGLDGEIETDAAGRDGSCLAALQRLNEFDVAGKIGRIKAYARWGKIGDLYL
jgi:hypothetical protein